MSDEKPLDAHDQALIDSAWDKHKNTKTLTPVQVAYALLWRSVSDCALAHRARRELLNALTKDEQREAIKWVVVAFGPMQTKELIAADIRAGIFPRRSYEPN